MGARNTSSWGIRVSCEVALIKRKVVDEAAGEGVVVEQRLLLFSRLQPEFVRVVDEHSLLRGRQA